MKNISICYIVYRMCRLVKQNSNDRRFLVDLPPIGLILDRLKGIPISGQNIKLVPIFLLLQSHFMLLAYQ